MLNRSAPEGKETKYALRELERRFLMATVPGEVLRRVHLVDHYITGTRLRLRHQRGEDGSIIRKLTQKVPQADGRPGLITTMYVDEIEYGALADLRADVLRKVRLSVPPFSIDLFSGRLAGLMIGEVEFESEAECDAYTPAPGVVLREITGDSRLTCAALAGSNEARIADALTAASRG